MTQLNRYSSRITQPRSQGGSQAMLMATGLTTEDLAKPQVGIASMWFDGNPCNMHLNDLAKLTHDGVKEADMVGMRFNTIGAQFPVWVVRTVQQGPESVPDDNFTLLIRGDVDTP